VFGVIVIILSIITWLVIDLSIVLDRYKDYWSEIGYTFEIIQRIKDVSIQNTIFQFFGFTPPPDKIQVIETEHTGQGFFTMKMKELPVSPHIMQAIADHVLTGTPFSEPALAGRGKVVSVNKFRQLSKKLKEQSAIKANSTASNNLGYSLTRKGQQIFYAYASESVKQQLKEKGVKIDAS
jgi:hypothetical protein